MSGETYAPVTLRLLAIFKASLATEDPAAAGASGFLTGIALTFRRPEYAQALYRAVKAENPGAPEPEGTDRFCELLPLASVIEREDAP